jgi:hypothetical protein
MTTETLNKVQEPERINDTRKAELLSTPIEHIDITKFDARPIVDAMGKMSFTSRDLARATKIYNTMLEDPECSIILVIAGSTSAGGCMDVYAALALHRPHLRHLYRRRAAAGLRLHHRQDRRQPGTAPLLLPRVHPPHGQMAERRERQEAGQPRPARLRA